MAKSRVIGVHVTLLFTGKYNIQFHRGQHRNKYYLREEYPEILADIVYRQTQRLEMEVKPGLTVCGWHARKT